MNLVVKVISSPWFWVDVFFNVVGAAVVFIGLRIGASAERLIPPTDFKPDIFADLVTRYRALMDRGHRIVMVGVAIEAVCGFLLCVIAGFAVADSSEKTASALLQAKNAGLLAAEVQQTNLVLRSTVAALEIKAQDRIITLEQREKFKRILRDAPKGPVMVGSRNPNDETKRYLDKVVSLLTNSGFTIQSSMNYGDNLLWLNEGSSIGIVIDNLTNAPPYTRWLQYAFNESDMPTTAFINPPVNQFGPSPRPGSNEVLILVVEKP
jgi:hypothetical protein